MGVERVDAMTATPEQIAAAWRAWKSRHVGKLEPGPGFVEAINAALAVSPQDRDAVRREALEEAARAAETTAVLTHEPGCHADTIAAAIRQLKEPSNV
jgi:hypothetical protein